MKFLLYRDFAKPLLFKSFVEACGVFTKPPLYGLHEQPHISKKKDQNVYLYVCMKPLVVCKSSLYGCFMMSLHRGLHEAISMVIFETPPVFLGENLKYVYEAHRGYVKPPPYVGFEKLPLWGLHEVSPVYVGKKTKIWRCLCVQSVQGFAKPPLYRGLHEAPSL